MADYYSRTAEQQRENARKRRSENRELMRAREKARYEKHKAKRLEAAAIYRKENKEKVSESQRKGRMKSPWKETAKARRREIQKIQSTPAWASRAKMAEFYKEATRLTKETGIVHHVDHIIPLRGKMVCGLHCEANLRVVTRGENLQKSNHFYPELIALAA
jgi:hypothetical protein